MIGFIELHDLENNPYILNMSVIESIMTDENGNTVIYPADQSSIMYYKARESYDEIKYKLREVLA